MREPKDHDRSLALYESHPPEWLPRAHGSADLGYPGFHPPRPGQDEDILSETNVKNGFVLQHHVSAETFSAQSMINDNLHSTATLSGLEALMNEVFLRRADRIPPIPPSSFRMPSRVTLNDSKRQAWFADLANPDVPLYKLGKSVPHGAKGHDLLDLLHSNNVAIPRAVWFLRVFGANETAGLRNKPSYNPIQYSIDWANVVTSYMKKQLADIALPSAPRPGLNIKQTFKGVLADLDTRERWISRFSYCLKLLRTFFSDGLIDSRTLHAWIVQQMGSCNLAQAGFITRLADEYLDGMISSRALTRPFIDACLCKISEIRTTSAHAFLCDTEELLKVLLQRICLALPDSFVSPRMWTVHASLLCDVLAEIIPHSGEQFTERNSREVGQVLLDNVSDIKRRNEAMLFRRFPVEMSVGLGSAVTDIKLLNSISSKTDLNNPPFCLYSADDGSRLAEKLHVLLTWSVTRLQHGDHRPFAAATLIRNWRDRAGDRATRRDFTPPDAFLQDQLFDWLDSSEMASKPCSLQAVALLFENLLKFELFSYANYIQRLVARGEQGLSFSEEAESRHRNFLRWIPLYDSTSSLMSQRNLTLYGARTRETPEDVIERDIRREIRVVLPRVFGGDTQTAVESTTTLIGKCRILMSSSRFEQARTLKQWLLPILQKHVVSQTSEVSQSTLLETYCISVELMAHMKCFESVLDWTLCLLEYSTTVDVLMVVINTLQRFATIWACMDVMGRITSSLYNAHQVWKVRGIQCRPLLSLLLEFDNNRHLHGASRERVTTDVAAFSLALQPVAEHPDVVPEVLPEILLLAGDPNDDAPSVLANSLWIKYRMSSDWAWKVWDNTVASLRQVPDMTADVGGRHTCALRYGVFLWHVDQHLPLGLDGEVLRWCLGPGKNEVAALSSDVWNILSVVVLYLSVHGALKTTTILVGLVYPAWQLCAGLSVEEAGHSTDMFLRAANNLCKRLLLLDDVNEDRLPPANLHEVQCIRTRRQDVYCLPHFRLLASSFPLLIFIENNQNIPEEYRNESASLRHLLSENGDFRRGAYQNLDVIQEVLEDSLERIDETAGDLNKFVVSGLRRLLCDSADADDMKLSEWPTVTSFLSPWNITATIQFQLTLKQMGRALESENTRQIASANLDKFIQALFHHPMTSDEASYIGEMVQDVDSLIAGKLFNNGLKCITDFLPDLCSTGNTASENFQRIAHLLRVLLQVARPFQNRTTSMPDIESVIQEEFLAALHEGFLQVESLIASNSEPRHGLTQETILMLRLLQFGLSFRNVWWPHRREIGDNLSSLLFKLAMIYGAPNYLDPVVYSMVVDTLYYLLDEMPFDPKAVPFDPFRNYPNKPSSDLPLDLPGEYHEQLTSLLPQFPAVPSVSNLVNYHRDVAGNIDYVTPVVNRPWEWVENLGDPTPIEPKGDEREGEKIALKARSLVKNSGSLSLDTFDARMTGDGILRSLREEVVDMRTEGNLRIFQDGLAGENIFKRDWCETRIPLDAKVIPRPTAGRVGGELVQEVGGIAGNPSNSRERRMTPRGSPSSSVVSRSSARASTASIRQSPRQGLVHKRSSSATSDVIDVDSVTTNSLSSNRGCSSKRKAAAITVSDDEIEIIEGPALAQASVKKAKTKGLTRAKNKKK